jgi:pimeloyl-ACP methyl ester carboxylesterase
MATLDPQPFEAERDGRGLRGEVTGDGASLLLLHGLTATRRYVVHGSNVLPRAGYRTIAYDARGHGESDPAPESAGYGYDELTDDLGVVLDEQVGGGAFVLAGHSMGAHTAVAYALRSPERIAGLVVIGPVYMGIYDDEALGRWDALADGLQSGGIEGFLEIVGRGADPSWRDTTLRFTRERMEEHRHLDAVARALREVPRSLPFEEMSELEFLDVPALVVASNDLADPHHPFAVAEAYAERLPQARLVSEEPGESPLAWQGGRLSREIVSFCAEPAVAERLSG